MKRVSATRKVILRNFSAKNIGQRLKSYADRSDTGTVTLSFTCRPGIPMPDRYSDEFRGEDGCWEGFFMETKGEVTPEGLVGLAMVADGFEGADKVGFAKVIVPLAEIADLSGGRVEVMWYEKGVADPGRAEGLALELADRVDFPHWNRL